MKAGHDALYGPLAPTEVLGFALHGTQATGPCRPAEAGMEVIHVEGAWDEQNPMVLSLDLIYKRSRYTVKINLATDEAVVVRHTGKARVPLIAAGQTSGRDYVTNKAVLAQANLVLHRIIRTLPFGGEEE